ncbi:MAG: undecaprenyl-diphosphate phosphatase [Synergistaceae bacterium]|nr:undecaprenyl-diphosphate phosphatase [Synergistaceae bacterium]MBR0248414.1 undecaprenyl-diphosphate phosphatase [Synergistaceae bacterium]
MLHSIILGAVQGLCEFLPVSSSGHLALFQIFMGFNENMLTFDILLHFATLLAVVLYFWRDILQILREWFGGWFGKRRSGWSYGWTIIIASMITAVIGLALKSTAERFSESLILVGAGEIFTGLILVMIPILSSSRRNSSLLSIAMFVGFAQGIAVLPGVSRSGMSIAMALFMGLGISEAFRFSFLISIPAVLGATLLECVKFLKSGQPVFMPEGYIWGAAVAFVLGLLALIFMRRLVNAKNWALFGVYCLIVGALAVFLS